MALRDEASLSTVNERLKNIFEVGEIDPTATIRKFRIVQKKGGREVSRQIDFYNPYRC